MSKIFDSVNVYGSGTTTGATFRTFDSSGNNTVIIRDDGKVGIGTTTPSTPLHVRSTAIPSAGEPIARFDVSDASGYVQIANSTALDGTFGPLIQGRQIGSSTQQAIGIEGVIDVADDTGTVPVTIFQSRLATLVQVVTRPVYQFRNWTLNIMTMLPNGNVGIGTTTPTETLDVNGKTKTTTFQLTTTPTAGHVLTSDASGNGTWQAASGGVNIYNSDGTLDANRTVNLNSNSVAFNNGNFGIGVTPTQRLDVNGQSIFRGNVNMLTGTTILWTDESNTFPTSVNNRIRWRLNNDAAEIYAHQRTSDALDLTFRLTDNNTTDSFVFWVDNGAATDEILDSIPLQMDGQRVVVNALRRYATSATTSGSGNVDFYILRESATTLNDSAMFVDVSTGNVGIGVTPTAKLHIRKEAQAGGENVAKFEVSDDLSSFLEIANQTGTNNLFLPMIRGIQGANYNALSLIGQGTTDTGSEALIVLDSRISNSAATVRPLCQWANYGSSVMILSASGNLGIGTTTPSEKLDVNGKTKTTTFQMTSGATNGYVLTSDVSGNATWQPSSSGSTFTGNTSASCINDLFVSNIHACSPLNINPLDEGNVYFGSTSAVTIDLANNRLGVGTSSPQYPLHVVTSSSTIEYQSNIFGGALVISGNTEIPRFDASGNGPFSVSLGVIASGATAPTYATRGNPTDSYLRASVFSNGLNIINAGPGGEDYIRFYAGKNANQSPSDIHIQGSGVTMGYIGIGIDSPSAKLHINNTTTGATFLVEDSTNPDSTPFVIDSIGRVGIGTNIPSEKLDVSGKTKTTNLQVTSGAVSGYLLTSDNNGNATWQVNSATTITINNNSNNRIITATGNNDEINGESNLTFDGNTLTSIKNSSSPNLIIRDTGTTSTDAYIRFLGLSGGTPSWAMGVNKGINNDFEIRYSSGSGASLANILAFAIQSASTGFYSYQFGPNNSVNIVTAPDAGQIRLRDNISDVETTLTRFTNYTAIAANDGSTDEPFYINNDSNSGRTSFGGGGVGGSIDQMEFYPDPRTDLPVNGGSGLYIKNNLSVDGTVRVGSVTSTGVAVYRNASTGILTTTSSDVRLKKDITQITNPLDIINNLRGVYYNWQSNDDFETDDTSRQIGLIAQEVEPVLPEAVVLNGVKDYKTVKYSEIVSVLIEGMKEQQKMINDLKQEIENLKNP
jgi:hypothetical protein